MSSLAYRRVLLKLSGEAFPGPAFSEEDRKRLSGVCRQIAQAQKRGGQMAVVVGAGNLVRGKMLSKRGMCSRMMADVAGMLATNINGILLRDALDREGCPCALFSSLPVEGFLERFAPEKVIACLDQGAVVILAGGTGMPFLTTDTAAALLALQIGANALFKATKVDGVYEEDPLVRQDAQKISELGAEDVLSKRLGIMDLSAAAICGENGLPVLVFSMERPEAIVEAFEGRHRGSQIHPFGSKRC